MKKYPAFVLGVLLLSICAISPQSAHAQKTWKLVSPSPGGTGGGSGGDAGEWDISCAGANTIACIRMNKKTGATECLYAGAGNAFNQWYACAESFTASGGTGGMNQDGIMQGGYFVLSHNSWNGNLGGRAGADAKCLSDLLTYPWKGKGSAGTITGTRVKSFLCDSTGCNNAQPFTQYRFATANIVSAGGATFTTDVDGKGPDNETRWSLADAFAQNANIWSGRNSYSAALWHTTGNAAYTCNNWTSDSSSFTAFYGMSNQNNAQRWLYTGGACNNQFKLICMVHPEAP